MKYTKHNLKKLEVLFEDFGYRVRYEKGNFNSGYCMVENQNIVVINKFFDTEGRMNVLLEVVGDIEVNVEALEDKNAKLYKDILKFKSKEETESSN